LKTLAEVKLRNLQEMLMLAQANNKPELIAKYKAEIEKMRGMGQRVEVIDSFDRNVK
jgi:hypothetical protein